MESSDEPRVARIPHQGSVRGGRPIVTHMDSRDDRIPQLERGTLVGKYRVERQLAQSRNSRVYLVEHQLTSGRAVLKLASPLAAERIHYEASVLSIIDSPYVPGLLQVGRLSEQHGRAAHIVLEVVAGSSLQELLRRQRRLEPGRALRVGMHLLEALAVCHERGIVHGDVKPANVVLTESTPERAVLIDFGAAWVKDQARPPAMATPGYAAPEVLRGEPPSPSSDIYSFACVLHEALCGRPAIRAAEAVVKPANQLVPIGAALSSLLLTCLHADALKRPHDGSELRERLLALDLEAELRYGDLGGEASRTPQEAADTLELVELGSRPPPEAVPSRPWQGDVTTLLSVETPSVWVFTGDPGVDQGPVREAIAVLAEHYRVEELDAQRRERKRIDFVSGYPPPWVIVFGDLHVLLGEPLLEEARRMGETSRLLVSTHENWELLDTSVNACGLHAQVCLPAAPEQIVGSVQRMVRRSFEARRRYDTLRLALQDVQEDLTTLRQHAG